MANVAVRRPFRKTDLHDHFRLDPALAARGPPAPAAPCRRVVWVERHSARLQSRQLVEQGNRLVRLPTRSNTPCVPQPLFVVVHPKHKRSNLFARPRASCITANHELLTRLALNLSPGIGACSAIGRIQPLGDDALKAGPARRRRTGAKLKERGLFCSRLGKLARKRIACNEIKVPPQHRVVKRHVGHVGYGPTTA